jgi:hypothetical protein
MRKGSGDARFARAAGRQSEGDFFWFLPGASLRCTPGFHMTRFQRFEFAPEAGRRTSLGWYRGI